MYRKFLSLIGWVLVFNTVVLAQQSMNPGAYPAPRYPEFKKHYSDEELLAIARVVVRKPALGPGAGNYQGRDASNLQNIGYNIQSGEKVLVAVPRSFEPRVLNAIVAAIREAGGKVDVLLTHTDPIGPARDGASEARWLAMRERGAPRGFSPTDVMKVAETGNYQILIHGITGRRPINIPFKWEFIPWNTLDKFVTGIADYPYELQELLDQKVWDALLKAKRVRVTDPEGTDISWSASREGFEEAGARKRFGIAIRGHVGLWPNNFFPKAQAPDAEGVIAGTINHSGVFPHVKVYLKEHSVTKIEGGGAYGEFWKTALEKYKNVTWPMHPGAGMGWLREAAVGTNPKATRMINVMEQDLRMSWDTNRTGVIHWGIGILGVGQGEPGREELLDFAVEEEMHLSHLHIHSYFPTVEVETEDGQKILVIDKGRLTALDDPEVRRIAAKYGDPDELLSENWIPALPGVNVPGDYMNDYGRNPAYWIREEHRNAYEQDIMESYLLR